MQAQVEDLQGPLAGTRAAKWAAVVVAAIALTACGGGGAGPGGGGPPSGGDPPTGGTGSSGTGSLRVKVSDALGDAVAGAAVSWLSDGKSITLRTDPQGIVQFGDLAGQGSLCAYHAIRGESCGDSADKVVAVRSGEVLELARRLQPPETPAAAVLSATIEPGGVSADRRSLDVVLRVAVSGPLTQGSWFVDGPEWDYNRLNAGCTARTGDELAQQGPRCIRGTGAGDASFSLGRVNDLGTARLLEEPVSPQAVGLLIDQSEAGASGDWLPNDPRLFAARLFSGRLLPDTPLLLGAFASDEPSGTASRLPQRPMTLFPVEAPDFLVSRTEVLGVLNELQALVGGGAPLYEAIAAGLDDLAARASPDQRRALVVLTNGADTTCGTATQCAALRREIIGRAHDAAIRLFIVAAGHEPTDCIPGWCTDWRPPLEPVGALAREGGFPMVVDPQGVRLGSAMELVRQSLSGSTRVQDIRVRLTSETAGAFAPGATVMGTLTGANGSECPMGCQVHFLPFTVEVP